MLLWVNIVAGFTKQGHGRPCILSCLLASQRYTPARSVPPLLAPQPQQNSPVAAPAGAPTQPPPPDPIGAAAAERAPHHSAAAAAAGCRQRHCCRRHSALQPPHRLCRPSLRPRAEPPAAPPTPLKSAPHHPLLHLGSGRGAPAAGPSQIAPLPPAGGPAVFVWPQRALPQQLMASPLPWGPGPLMRVRPAVVAVAVGQPRSHALAPWAAAAAAPAARYACPHAAVVIGPAPPMLLHPPLPGWAVAGMAGTLAAPAAAVAAGLLAGMRLPAAALLLPLLLRHQLRPFELTWPPAHPACCHTWPSSDQSGERAAAGRHPQRLWRKGSAGEQPGYAGRWTCRRPLSKESENYRGSVCRAGNLVRAMQQCSKLHAPSQQHQAFRAPAARSVAVPPYFCCTSQPSARASTRPPSTCMAETGRS